MKRNLPLALALLLLGMNRADAAANPLGIDPEQFRFASSGAYLSRVDERDLIHIDHPLTTSKKGDYGKISTKVLIPADAKPPFLLSFYYNDNNERTGAAGPKAIGATGGSVAEVIDEREGHRLQKCWINDREVWSMDTLASNSSEPHIIDITQYVSPGTEVNLAFGLEEIVNSDVELPGDRQLQARGTYGSFKLEFPKYETRSYWGNFAIYHSGKKPATGPAPWPWKIKLTGSESIPHEPVESPPLNIEYANLLGTQSRWAWPVSMGIPFEKGSRQDDNVGLTANEPTLEYSFSPLSRWQDGSLKWALLNFTATPQNAAASFKLAEGNSTASKSPSHPVKLAQQKKQAILDNDLLRVSIRTKDDSPITLANREGAFVRKSSLHAQAKGKDLKIFWKTIDVKRQTPWQTELWLQGEIKDDAGPRLGECRLETTMFANVPYARVRLVILGQSKDPIEFTNIGLRLLTEGKEKQQFGRGWATASTSKATLVGAIRYFQHLWPIGIQGSEGEMDFQLFQEADKRVPLIRSALGDRFSREIWLALTPETITEAEAESFSQLVETPPRLNSSSLIRKSRAWGFIPQALPDSPVYSKIINAHLAPFFSNPARGALDFGDYKLGILRNHYWNTIHTMYSLYAMTGERRWYDWAELAVHHQIDLSINYENDGERPLGGIKYRQQPDGPLTFNGKNQQTDALFDHWQMTGHTEARDLACGVANFLIDDKSMRTNSRSKSSRENGWPILFLMRAYNETFDDRYLKAAEELVKVANANTEPRRGAYIQSHGNPSFRGIVPFMSGILLSGLREYHLVTEDKTAGKLLVKTAWGIYAEMHNPTTTLMAPNLDYEYSPNPYHRDPLRYPPSGSMNVGICAGQAYAAAISGDKRLLEIAKSGWNAFLDSKTSVNTPGFCYDLPAALYWTSSDPIPSKRGTLTPFRLD